MAGSNRSSSTSGCAPVFLGRRETAGIVLEGRELKLEVDADLEEIHPGGDWSAGVEAIAYAFRDAAEPGARFMGGEVLSEFAARVAAAVELSLRGDWATALFVCHGVTNRAILAWSLQTDLSLFQHIEQDSCCLNVIDVDVDPRDGRIVRRLLRCLNLTSYAPVKRGIELTTMEQTALTFQSIRAAE